MKYKTLAVLGAALLSFSFNTAATQAAPHVPENIFRWVQSSSRTNYFFNRQQMCFAVDAEGRVDTNVLIAPVLKTFDDIMIKDVVAKRRWNGKSLQGFGDLVGVAEYLTINLKEQKVSVDQVDYLDSTWSTIESVRSEEAWVSLEAFSEKSWDGEFYERVVDFAMRNQLILAERTKGTLDEDTRAELARAQEEYRAEHTPDRPSDNE